MKITILGGGVAGLCSAIALKLVGIDAEVYERRASTSEIGAGIVCWPNACFVLEQLGMLEPVAKVSGALQNMHRISSTGQPLGSLDITLLNTHMGYPSYSIIRKDLMGIIDQRVHQLGIKVHYGQNVQQIASDGSGQALVTFDHGATIKSDLVIGADGRMNSAARAFVNGDNKPVYQRFINWIGVFESEQPLFTDISVSDYWGIGSRFGIVPVNNQKAYWAGGVAADTIGERDPQHYRSDLRALFTGWSETITQIIEQTPLQNINKVYVHDHNPIDIWHKENVLLIGDAAHAPLPTSGQGACQAMEDAWHLARLLKQGGELETIFTEFTQLRLAKTKNIAKGGRHFAASLFNTDPQKCQQRNQDSINSNFTASAAGMAQLWAGRLKL